MIQLVFNITVVIIVITLAIFFFKEAIRSKGFKEKLKQKAYSIDVLFKNSESITEKKDEYHKRVIELENSIQDGYGVKIRNEITEVIIDFTKIEIVMMLAGVTKLLERTSSPDDARIYVSLIDKITGFIENMREEGEGPFGSEGQG